MQACAHIFSTTEAPTKERETVILSRLRFLVHCHHRQGLPHVGELWFIVSIASLTELVKEIQKLGWKGSLSPCGGQAPTGRERKTWWKEKLGAARFVRFVEAFDLVEFRLRRDGKWRWNRHCENGVGGGTLTKKVKSPAAAEEVLKIRESCAQRCPERENQQEMVTGGTGGASKIEKGGSQR